MFSLLVYAIIFFVILIIGVIAILIVRYKQNKKKAGIPVMVIQPDAFGNSSIILDVGSEVGVDTQKMLDLPKLNRQFTYPSPTTMIDKIAAYIQTSTVVYRPLIVESAFNTKPEIKKLLANIDTIDQEGKAKLADYLEGKDTLAEEIDPAYLQVYAKNAKREIELTKVEENSLMSKLVKFLPIITIVATAIALAIVFNAFQPLYTTLAGNLHPTLSCTIPNYVANTTNTTITGI
ncbi:MAG: hypothetical protein QW478_07765 [Candidatus Micrarchaeaceae archaeon]